jgi:hypothetical protein
MLPFSAAELLPSKLAAVTQAMLASYIPFLTSPVVDLDEK